MASFRHVRSTQMCCTNWKNALAWLLLLWLCTPAKCSESFSYSKVNNGEPTNLVCVVSGVPPPPAGNISVVSTVGGGEGLFFQGTIVTGSTRAVSYQVNVLLDEVPQNFSCLVHRPDGSIVSKDLSVSVYEPPWFSFNEANILVGETSSDSITISWRPWDETHDNGDGPVIGYRVYYNIHGENTHQRASNDIITDTVYTITNLTRDTEYDFRVTAVREGRKGEGTLSSMASFLTQCSALSEAPVLTVSNAGQTFISLSWKLIPEDSWGCRTLSGIQITLSTDGQIEYQRNFSAAATSATITELQVCTRYSIRAAFNNKNNFGFRSATLSASTSMTPPARVVGLQASPSATQIEVSWESSTTLCPPDYYIIRYSLYQRLACPSPETFSTEFEVNTTSQRNDLADLEPYSRYEISVVAVNGAGRSAPINSYASTSSGPPPTITNVMVDQERTSPTSIGFTWQPLTCENVNGEFRYYYTRIYKDGNRGVNPVGREYHANRTISSVEFDNLEPCTMYELNIYAVSSGVPSDVSRAFGVTGVSFTGASVYAIGDQPSLTVYWSVPSQCNVDYYKLSYQLITRKACPDIPVIDAPRYELNVTSMLTFVSKRLLNLEYYSTYAISIIAVIRGAEILPQNVSGDTAEGEPSPLHSVSYTSTDVSLHFMWEEPSCENRHGIIRRYEYDLYNMDEGRTVQPVLNSLLNDVQFYNLDACTRYRFRVRVVTASNRRSDWYIKTAFTNISAPGVPIITQLTQFQEEVGATGLTVSWQPPTWPRCQPTHYEIQYYLRQGDSCEDVTIDPQIMLAVVLDGSNFIFNIDNLRPNSEYMVFVRGNNTSGYGDWDSESAPTGYSYPSGPPANIRSLVTKKRRIVFTWEKPECGNRNGPITHYDVQLYNSTGFLVHQENVTADQILDYEIFDLIPYSNYSIMIRAWNYELAGVYSQEVWAQTNEARPGPPIGVIIPSSDLESITVEWMSPNPPLGRIIRYNILYWETDAADTTRRNISIPCRDGHCSDVNYRFSEIIPDLQSETNYSIQVQAETSLGAGALSPSEPAVAITSEGFPSNPQDLAIHSSSNSSFMITWMPPKYPRGRIISYTLGYKVKGKPYDSSFRPEDSFTMKDIDGSETSFLLESLEPATLYEVYVVASTSKGEGESSAHVEEYTSPTPGCFDACSKICRCSEGVSDCDTVTGACSSGRCMNGWSGSNCQIVSPRLSEPPSPVYTSCDTIAIIWKVWNGDRDSGEGPIGGYDIYVKTKTSAWAKFDFVIQDNPSLDILRYVLNDLEPDVEYTISVSPVHIDDIGKSREYDGRGEEVMIRTVQCETRSILRSIPWAGIVSGVTLFFIIICGGLFIGKWVYGRRASMNVQGRRTSRPLPPVKRSSPGDDFYENPSFSGLSKKDQIYSGLYEDIKSSDQANLQNEEKHEYEQCDKPPSTMINEYEDVKRPKNDEEHEYEVSLDPPNRVLYENRDVKVISLSN